MGVDHVNILPGSREAKERLRVILENIAGRLTVAEACAALGIEQSRFFELKRRSLEQWVQGLEPESPGRRPSTPELDPARQAELEAENRDLRRQLDAARLRAELARAAASSRPKTTGQARKKKRADAIG